MPHRIYRRKLPKRCDALVYHFINQDHVYFFQWIVWIQLALATASVSTGLVFATEAGMEPSALKPTRCASKIALKMDSTMTRKKDVSVFLDG